MLYLRGLTLKNKGSVKNPDRYLVCALSVGKSEFAITRNCSIWESNNEQNSAFNALCKKFGVEEEDEFYVVEKTVELEGDFFECECKEHYVRNSKGDRIVDEDTKKEVTTTNFKGVYCSEWGQTKESVLKSFERTWKKNKDIVEPKEE